MSDATAPEPTTGGGPVEEKTKFGAYVSYAGAFVLFTLLTSTTTDLSFLPDWLETVLYPLVPALASLAGSYYKTHKPGKLSLSALRAARTTI